MHKITSEVSLWFITWQLYGNVGGPAGIERKRERLRVIRIEERKIERMRRKIEERKIERMRRKIEERKIERMRRRIE